MNRDAKQRRTVDGVIAKKTVVQSIAKKRYRNVGRENMNLKNARRKRLKEKKKCYGSKKNGTFLL